MAGSRISASVRAKVSVGAEVCLTVGLGSGLALGLLAVRADPEGGKLGPRRPRVAHIEE